MRALRRTSWIVYAKRPFGGPEQVLRYLGRYTHRVGISNQRLVAIEARGVTFRTRDGKAMPREDSTRTRARAHRAPNGSSVDARAQASTHRALARTARGRVNFTTDTCGQSDPDRAATAWRTSLR